ncbi:MAG TPA: dihydrolipoamide acetyltransferase family protein [Solirubrobacteraceae bacterium]|nr:dihydrolipoamide acetyltransferase family protein [Solirubrobacteraceae bacterium]
MAEIVMPRLSDTMEEGTILRWLKRDGDHVGRGEELVEIETDKATMSYESDQSGVLQTVAGEGDTLAVGELIARVGDAEPGGEARAQADDEEDRPASRPAEVRAREAAGRPVHASAGAGAIVGAADGATRGRHAGERVKASPLARRLARESHVDLAALSGSGPGGRIVRADVEAAAVGAPAGGGDRAADAGARTGVGAGPAGPGGATPGSELAGVASAKGETTSVELSRSQQTIARRMAESKATIPDFALDREVDMEACAALRAELKRLSGLQAPTYNDMIVKACALALREHPRANSSYRDGRLALHARVNVGVAVAVAPGEGLAPSGAGASSDATAGAGMAASGAGASSDATAGEGATARATEGGSLVVPTVFDADAKSLGEIARETRALAARVRDGTITPPELGGGTFTVSNLGMLGVRSFSAVINPPQVAILAVGAVEPRALVRDGEVAVRHALSATLVCDHRVLYGADAALFFARICELLGEPAALTL